MVAAGNHVPGSCFTYSSLSSYKYPLEGFLINDILHSWVKGLKFIFHVFYTIVKLSETEENKLSSGMIQKCSDHYFNCLT